jgi:curved DNA-binding protein CbpA
LEASKDYYAILGVSPAADPAVIKAAYRALAQLYHPDKVEPSRKADATRRMAQINEAYAILGDPEARQAYDSARVDRTASRSESPSQPSPAASWRPSRAAFLASMALTSVLAMTMSIDRKTWLQRSWEFLTGGFVAPAEYEFHGWTFLVIMTVGYVVARVIERAVSWIVPRP